MTQKRRKHSGAFKARVALEAVRGVKTINQIAAEHEIHPVQVSQWKKELETRMAEIFEKPQKANEKSKTRETERLERKVGQLTMDLDWLKKKCDQLQIPTDDLP